VYAPVSPLLRLVADRVWLQDGALLVERDGHRVRVPFAFRIAGDLDASYVAVGPLLRALGDSVRYRKRGRCLDVRTPALAAVASPTPFDASRPSGPPRAVFTPEATSSPRPVWSGSPLPRRTPLPLPPRSGRRLRRG
jgi:hypothetical protein